jgi:manganese/zinc/iron transport system permease protein
MIGLAALLGALAGLGGVGLAMTINASIAGAIVTVAGLLFGLALIFSPAHGLLTRWRRQRRLVRQLAADLLAAELAELGGQASLALLRQHLGWAEPRLLWAVAAARRRALIAGSQADFRLTPAGRAAAAARDALVPGPDRLASATGASRATTGAVEPSPPG